MKIAEDLRNVSLYTAAAGRLAMSQLVAISLLGGSAALCQPLEPLKGIVDKYPVFVRHLTFLRYRCCSWRRNKFIINQKVTIF